MKEFRALLKRELKVITKEKTILLAVFVQLIIALLSTAILEGVMAFYDPDFSRLTAGGIDVGFVSNGESQLVEYIRESDISISGYTSLADAEEEFTAGNIDVILILPKIQTSTVVMTMYLPKLEAKKTSAQIALDKPLRRYEDYLREENGVTIHYAGLNNRPFSPFEFTYTVLIPILMLFPALVAGSMVIDSISEEYENSTIETLLSAPVSAGQVFLSKITAAVITAVIQVCVWSGLMTWNGVVIEKLPLVLLLAISYAVNISLGAAIIGILFKDRQRSQFTYSMILIGIGAASYFLSPSPIDLITKLASGAPGTGYIAFIIFALIPVPLGMVFYRIAMSGK